MSNVVKNAAGTSLLPPNIDSNAPATHAFEITPHDTNALEVPTRGIIVDDAGSVTVRFKDSEADVILALLPSVVYPFVLSHVRATGTDAISIVGLS